MCIQMKWTRSGNEEMRFRIFRNQGAAQKRAHEWRLRSDEIQPKEVCPVDERRNAEVSQSQRQSANGEAVQKRYE